MIKSINCSVVLFLQYTRTSFVQKCSNYSTLVQLPFKEKRSFSKPLLFLVRQVSKKEVSKKLQDLLNVNNYGANCIISNDTNFAKIPTEHLEKNYNLCIEHGLSKETVASCPNILADTALLYKLKTIKTLPYDVNVTAPLLSIAIKKFMGFLNEELDVKRIDEFAKLFRVEVNDVCKWLSSKPFLTSISMSNVKKSTKILLDSGVTLQAVIDDLWVLRYSPTVVEERIKLAKENNIDVIKTWMVRAQRDIFDNYVRRRSDTKKILGDKHDLVEYLSEKLECSSEVSKFLISKQPALQKKSLKKMNDMIDFLFINGFKPIHICRTPKILLHSVETIRKRLKELEANNVQLDSLHILTKSQRQYMSFIDSMKSNKVKIKN